MSNIAVLGNFLPHFPNWTKSSYKILICAISFTFYLPPKLGIMSVN